MSKEMWVIILGLWIIVVPYLGIPGSWKTIVLVATGIGVAIAGFLLRGETLSRNAGSGAPRPFTDSREMRHETQGINSLN